MKYAKIFMKAYHEPDLEIAKKEMKRCLEEDFGWIKSSSTGSNHLKALEHFIDVMTIESGMIYGMIYDAFNKLMEEQYGSKETQ